MITIYQNLSISIVLTNNFNITPLNESYAIGHVNFFYFFFILIAGNNYEFYYLVVRV